MVRHWADSKLSKYVLCVLDLVRQSIAVFLYSAENNENTLQPQACKETHKIVFETTTTRHVLEPVEPAGNPFPMRGADARAEGAPADGPVVSDGDLEDELEEMLQRDREEHGGGEGGGETQIAQLLLQRDQLRFLAERPLEVEEVDSPATVATPEPLPRTRSRSRT